jgi:uncharacterized protein YegL
MRRCTDITLILDKSGSMWNCRDATIEMVNGFIQTRREDADPCVMSIVQFSTGGMFYRWNWSKWPSVPVQEIALLDRFSYAPIGATALYDAVGETIDRVGERLANLPESERPDKVIIAILTDGLENDSVKRQREEVEWMVQHQQSVYNWQFIYMGADMNSFVAKREAQAIGIAPTATLNYAKISTRAAGVAFDAAFQASAQGHELNFDEIPVAKRLQEEADSVR